MKDVLRTSEAMIGFLKDSQKVELKKDLGLGSCLLNLRKANDLVRYCSLECPDLWTNV